MSDDNEIADAINDLKETYLMAKKAEMSHVRDLNTTLSGVTKQLSRIAQHLESLLHVVHNPPDDRS